jgi:hypothetical protein
MVMLFSVGGDFPQVEIRGIRFEALRELSAPSLQVLRATDLCRALGDMGGVSQARLAEWLGTLPSGVIPVLDSLAERGLA